MDRKVLQTALAKLGLYTLKVDGMDGPGTQKAVVALLNKEAPRTPFSKWRNDRRELAAKQIVMRLAGIDVGEIDGLIGPQTRAAMEEYAGEGVDRKQVEKENFAKIETLEKLELKPIWPVQSQVTKFYGAVGKNQGRIKMPWRTVLAWDKDTVVKTISVHEKCADSAQRVLNRIASAYSPQQIVELGLHLFGGSLNVRKMRGGNAYSMHSWGIAIDFDPERNQLKWGRDRARLAKPDAEIFWGLWEEEGWLSLGRARNYDWMHVQAARL